MHFNMGQMIIIDENEYNILKVYGNVGCELVKELNKIYDEFYHEYQVSSISNIDFAWLTVEKLKNDINNSKKKWWRKFFK